MPSITARDLIKEALMEMGAYSQGETPSAADSAFGLSKVNRLLDTWNARSLFIYDTQFSRFTLTPNLNPHTIGPSTATFAVDQRPVKILDAAIIITTSSPEVRVPMNIRDDQWWAGLGIHDVASSIPSNLYYSEAWPNGEINLWPKPDTDYDIELQIWTILGQLADLDAIVNLPPGYQDALTYGLAVTLCPAFGKNVDPVLATAAQQAWVTVQRVNAKSPRISSDFPDSEQTRSTGYNVLIGGYPRS